jgi:hypothetical protein
MEIPIIFEMVQKSKLDFSDEIAKKGRALTPHEFILAAHAIAFCAAVLRMEEMMRQLWPREVGATRCGR